MSEPLQEQHREWPPRSMEEILNIMLGDDDRKRHALQQWLEKDGMMNKEQFELCIAAQRLRREVHAEQRKEVKRRVETNPCATPQELALGAFLEQIEPQVRDAVFRLREKGYDTLSSGFTDFGGQSIEFVRSYFINLEPAIRRKLEALGVTIKARELFFPCKIIDLESMRATWNAIVELLPPRDALTPPTDTPAAHDFRKQFDEEGVLKPNWKKYYLK